MKRTSLLVTAAFVFVFTSCQEDATTEEQVINEVYSTLGMDSEASIESGFEDIDVIVDAGMDYGPEDGRLGGGHHGNRMPGDRMDRVLECATVEKDTVNNMVTIDFGDGCEDHHGVVRRGKIIIQYSGRRYESGSYRMVTFDGFGLDSLTIEGVRTITNISEDSSSVVKFETTLEGGKITFADGTFATREASHVRTWYRAESREDDYATLTGAATGVNRQGTDYASEILSELTLKRSCRESRVVIPVAGILQITVGENQALIDFGDGTCDNEVTVTIDGETTTKTIEPKGRFRRRK